MSLIIKKKKVKFTKVSTVSVNRMYQSICYDVSIYEHTQHMTTVMSHFTRERTFQVADDAFALTINRFYIKMVVWSFAIYSVVRHNKWNW